jgi:HEPN domain-containing protein
MDQSLEVVKYWKDSALDALDTSNKLFESKKYNHSLFFIHLSLEKILKALYIQIKKDSPPPIHDLIRLAEKCDLNINEKVKLELAEISTFNVSARYDDYKLKFYKKATKEYAEKWRALCKRIFDRFLSQLS